MSDTQKCLATQSIEHWLEKQVIGLNLCPFARQPWTAGRVHIDVVSGSDEDLIYERFLSAIYALQSTPIDALETTLLVLESGYESFDAYLGLLDKLDTLIDLNEWRGTFQIASFHPLYQFEGTDVDSRENYTNRAPLPVFHLLREDSISKARLQHPDTESIPQRNIELLEEMDDHLFEAHFRKA